MKNISMYSGREIACVRSEKNFHKEAGKEKGEDEAWFMCPYSWPRSDNCEQVYEESPFESIPASFW